MEGQSLQKLFQSAYHSNSLKLANNCPEQRIQMVTNKSKVQGSMIYLD